MNKWAAEEIKNLRLRLGWPAAEFARYFGAKSDLIINWERGAIAPTAQDILQLDRLSFHAESYSQQIERQPAADRCLGEMGREQIHSDIVSDLNRNK